MYETAVVVATEKCSLGAKIPKMSLQAYDNSCQSPGLAQRVAFPIFLLPFALALFVGA